MNHTTDMGRQSMSEQQKGPTPSQMKLMAALNRVGIYPVLEYKVPIEGRTILVCEEGCGKLGVYGTEQAAISDGESHGHLCHIDRASYHVDLFLRETSTDIEVDGKSHAHRQEKDAERDAYLMSIGIKTVRLSNSHVNRYADETAAIIGAMV